MIRTQRQKATDMLQSARDELALIENHPMRSVVPLVSQETAYQMSKKVYKSCVNPRMSKSRATVRHASNRLRAYTSRKIQEQRALERARVRKESRAREKESLTKNLIIKHNKYVQHMVSIRHLHHDAHEYAVGDWWKLDREDLAVIKEYAQLWDDGFCETRLNDTDCDRLPGIWCDPDFVSHFKVQTGRTIHVECDGSVIIGDRSSGTRVVDEKLEQRCAMLLDNLPYYVRCDYVENRASAYEVCQRLGIDTSRTGGAKHSGTKTRRSKK